MDPTDFFFYEVSVFLQRPLNLIDPFWHDLYSFCISKSKVRPSFGIPSLESKSFKFPILKWMRLCCLCFSISGMPLMASKSERFNFLGSLFDELNYQNELDKSVWAVGQDRLRLRNDFERTKICDHWCTHKSFLEKNFGLTQLFSCSFKVEAKSGEKSKQNPRSAL